MQSDSSKFESSGINAVPTGSGTLALAVESSYVYLVYGHADDLLYVGLTDDIAQRIAGHRHDRSEWLTYAEYLRWEAYPSRAVARAVEKTYIRTLHPLFNVAHRARQAEVKPEYTSRQWRRLGMHVRDRRTELRRTQASIARDAAVPVAQLRQLEAGLLTELPDAADRIELALGWHLNSMRSVLAGGSAEAVTAAERQRDALDVYDAVWSRA